MRKRVAVGMLVAGLIVTPILLGYDVTIGGWILSKEALEREHLRGYRRPRIVVGGGVMAEGIDGRTLTEVVPSLIVIGGLVAPKDIGRAYGKNLKVIGGVSFRETDTNIE